MATTRKQMFLEKMNGGSLSTPTPVTIEEEILDGTSGHTLPAVSPSDADKVLQVVNGKWVADWIDRSTTLFTDGTLIINEKLEDRDSNITKHGAVVKEYEPFGEKNNYTFAYSMTTGKYNHPWYDERTSILSVEIGSVIAPKRCSRWFFECKNATSFDLRNLNTKYVTHFSGMFQSCESVQSLDVSNFDTSNAVDMSSMFMRCKKLKTLDLFNFNTSKVNNMSSMFQFCYKLTDLNISSFSTSNVTSFSAMFNGCEALTYLDVSNFDTSKSIAFSGMFQNCSTLTEIDVSNFNTVNNRILGYMFSGCNNLTILDISNFDTSNLVDIKNMFINSSNLTTIIVNDKFSTDKVVQEANRQNVFTGCTSLVGGNGTVYDSSHTDAEYARIDTPEHAGYFTSVEQYENGGE